MAYNQTLWLNQDVEMSRQILQRLAPTAEARAAKAKTDRERGFLAALEVLFGPGEKDARDRAYAEAMGRLAAAFPDDLEVLCFHALALMGTAVRSPALFGDGGDDKHQHALVGSDTQKQVAAILEKVLARQPHHPGALHYLIHNYDDPTTRAWPSPPPAPTRRSRPSPATRCTCPRTSSSSSACGTRPRPPTRPRSAPPRPG